MLLLAGRYADAERMARQSLEAENFNPEATGEIVNYEVARKLQGKKVDVSRLESVLKVASGDDAEAAVYALLGKKSEVIRCLRNLSKKNKTFRYAFARWPVFAHLRDDSEVRAAAGMQSA